MNKKMLLKWLSIFVVVTISLMSFVTYVDNADNSRQRAQASAEVSDVDEQLKNALMNNDSSLRENEQETTQQETTVMQHVSEEGKEPETLDVEKETVITSTNSIRKNEGARVYADIDPEKPMIALTFDDGPNNKNTKLILDALNKYNGRATFFVVGYEIEDNEEAVKLAYEQGCEIGSHTYGHKNLTKLTIAQVKSEVSRTEKAIKKITGQKRVLLRPPYGAVTDEILKEIKTPIIFWSIDTEDWLTKDINKTVDYVVDNVKDGDVVLMHDSYNESARAAVKIIEKLTKKGYQLVTVSELGYHKFGGLANGIKYGAMNGD